MRLSGVRLMVCVSCEQTSTSHPPTGMDHSPVFPFLMVYSEIMNKNKPSFLEVPPVRHLVTNEKVPWTLIESPITSKLLWLWLFLHLLHLSSFLMPAHLYKKNCLLSYQYTVSVVHYLEHNSEREIFLYWFRDLMFMNFSKWSPQVRISH